MFAALCMIMVNKWVLISTETPLFFLLAQLVIAILMFLVTHALGLFKVTLSLQWDVCVGLWPMIFLNVLGLSANNYCLKYVDASFYQVARGLVLPLTVVLSLVFLKASRPTLRVLAACAIVTVGFFVGVALDSSNSKTPDQKKTSLLGIAFGLLSSLTTASHAIVIKRSLPVVNGDAIELAWYSNVLSSILLIPVIWLVGEGSGVLGLLSSPIYLDGNLSVLGRFLWGSLVTGLVGWLLSIAGVLSIKITSPITHMVSGAVRGILQTILGVWYFGDIVTTGRGTSIFVILAGSTYYTWAKNEEVLEQRAREQGMSKIQAPSPVVFDAEGDSRDIEAGQDPTGQGSVPTIQSVLAISEDGDSHLGSAVQQALTVIEETLEQDGEQGTAISFNGGKDCTVLLHLLAVALWRRRSRSPKEQADCLHQLPSECPPEQATSQSRFNSLYVTCSSPFPEVEAFVDHCAESYSLGLFRTSPGGLPMKDALKQYKEKEPKIKSILVGTRRSDPHGDKLDFTTPTDDDWPAYQRVHPILNWSYSQVWEYLRRFEVPYCDLYNRGYVDFYTLQTNHPEP
ncbi:hypothetical protein FRC16_006597 [Serendipita sp. 398]|nr:hypothetical protein FRC16_006597 [Serendipita sp. 398]